MDAWHIPDSIFLKLRALKSPNIFFPFIDSYQGPLKTDDFGADLHFHSFSKTTKLIQNQCVFAVHWQVWVEYHIHHWSARVAPIHARPSACSANVGGSWRRCVFGQTSQNSGICGVGVGSKKIKEIQRVLQSCFVFVLTPRQARSERNDDHWVFSSVTSLNNPDISWKRGIRNNYANLIMDIKISQIHSEEYLYLYYRVFLVLVPSTCKGVGFQFVSIWSAHGPSHGSHASPWRVQRHASKLPQSAQLLMDRDGVCPSLELVTFELTPRFLQ